MAHVDRKRARLHRDLRAVQAALGLDVLSLAALMGVSERRAGQWLSGGLSAPSATRVDRLRILVDHAPIAAPVADLVVLAQSPSVRADYAYLASARTADPAWRWGDPAPRSQWPAPVPSRREIARYWREQTSRHTGPGMLRRERIAEAVAGWVSDV